MLQCNVTYAYYITSMILHHTFLSLSSKTLVSGENRKEIKVPNTRLVTVVTSPKKSCRSTFLFYFSDLPLTLKRKLNFIRYYLNDTKEKLFL